MRPSRAGRGSSWISRTSEEAIPALSAFVTARSRPDALEIAIRACHEYFEARPDETVKPCLYFVDLGLDRRPT